MKENVKKKKERLTLFLGGCLIFTYHKMPGCIS